MQSSPRFQAHSERRAHSSIAPYGISLLLFACYGALVYIWQHKVLAEEKGLYSPFQSGLSFIRFLGLLLLVNFCMSLSAWRRDSLWIYIPLFVSGFLLLLALFYINRILALD